ncbi:predicted protein [Naegleria gruberi]|uniref:gluconokinase n=1 Tax=Naegleria gruberi TaxID=5762 RepID=D2VVB3_NAEGR|nr:uncharacterized protein NAEGRDRAFT_72955 [Naegleria gruberi]EFC39279.1 predicted protein [Naegleria gruberi]|eukprot:XP_002672023.1 predicted protein [Naegleria gruberi strain NEG-M]
MEDKQQLQGFDSGCMMMSDKNLNQFTSSENVLNTDERVNDDKYLVIVLFGVCGCGKSTIGEALTQYLNECGGECCFLEGDKFHSKSNVEKMAKGIPLNDQDRRPWLLAIHLQIMNEIKHSNRKIVVVSCSALKNIYRELLVLGDAQLCENEEELLDKPIQHNVNLDINWLFVNLSISQNEAQDRLENRSAHFMNSSLIPSQFETLELTINPTIKNAKLVVVDNQEKDVASVVQQIIQLTKQ